ncbi:hypothetical protein C8R47DRAFT_1077094 [Mycena vitilis]|nr:hypothetical protein C8R47DRAFT_1077094 [Mycena vitilis]
MLWQAALHLLVSKSHSRSATCFRSTIVHFSMSTKRKRAPPTVDKHGIPSRNILTTRAPEPVNVEAPESAQLLEEFEPIFPLLIRLLLAYEADPRVGTACSCGKGKRTTQCRDCRQYDLSCETCWTERHVNNPFHWAHVWDPTLCFFVKRDISMVDSGKRPFALGHYGQPCPKSPTPHMITVFDTNGIHATLIHWCEHTANPDKEKHVQLMKAEAKEAALNYIASLRRLTDNSQTAKDPYPAFLPTTRVYQHLKMVIRLGQAHGIDVLMPHRPPGDLVVPCPRCPKVGLNILGDIPDTPPYFRKIQTMVISIPATSSKTAIHAINPFATERHQFQPDKEYREYMNGVPSTKEKSTQTYLKAVNRQDKKKFKNMDVTGTINVQCAHVFVLATGDMYRGEGFASTDAALARQIRRMDPQNPFSIKLSTVMDRATTYDIVCEYSVNIKQRFRRSPHLQDVAHIVERMRRTACMRMARRTWSVSGTFMARRRSSTNKIGGHARHANNGHRRDMLVNNANDWNWKKTVNMHVSLYDDLQSAKKPFEEKLPSQTAIYQEMVRNVDNFASMRIPTDEVSVFLDEGLKIQEVQREIVYATEKNDEHNLQSTENEIQSRRSKLILRLGKWREAQARMMSDAAETIQIPQSSEEGKLRHGEAYDLIRVLQSICKTLTNLRDRKAAKKSGEGQQRQTIAGEQILDAERRRDNHISSYNSVRAVMISLGTCDEADPASPFPPLIVSDTFMKSRRRERALGDSRRGDGLLFTNIGITAGSKISHPPDATFESEDEEDLLDGGARRQAAPDPRMNKKPAEKRKTGGPLRIKTGGHGRPSNMSEQEMRDWGEEGDRVQWARSEGEIDRFQEQMELKLAEFLRCIISFRTVACIWTTMGSTTTDRGFPEFARQTAEMSTRLEVQCKEHLEMAGYRFALAPDFDLIQSLEGERDSHDTFHRERGLVPRDKREEARLGRDTEKLRWEKAAAEAEAYETAYAAKMAKAAMQKA